jgi:predicted transcriptional regulator of viral defense system
MAETTEIQALSKIKKASRGTLFFVENFLSLGSAKAMAKALERLTKQGELVRVARGIYVRPEIDPVIGPVTPGIEAVAEAIARRDKARIIPTGVYALNRLGLSTQVPLNVVYLTDGAARKVKIGKRNITFKRATPKNVATIGQISGLAIQALKTIGKNKVTTDEIAKIQEQLKKEKFTHLQHDIRLAPDWIRLIMQPVLNENKV